MLNDYRKYLNLVGSDTVSGRFIKITRDVYFPGVDMDVDDDEKYYLDDVVRWFEEVGNV